METKKNKDGSYTVSGELKWTDTRTCRAYEYSEEMKEDLLKLAKKKEEKGLFLGELDDFVGGLPNFGGQTAIRSESTSNDVLSLAKVSHKCKNIRIEENTIIADITPLKTKEGTPGDILQTLLDAEFEFRPVVRAIGVPGEPGEFKITQLISVDLVAIDKEHREPWHQPTKNKEKVMRRDRHGLPRKDVTAIKWKCAICDSVQVSRSDRRHEMDVCTCEKSALDLEEYYQRNMGAIVVLEQVECDYKEMLIPGLEQDISILAAVKVLAVQDLENHIRYQVIEDKAMVANIVTYYEEQHGVSIKEGDELKYYLRNWLRNYRAKQNKEDETNQDTQKNED